MSELAYVSQLLSELLGLDERAPSLAADTALLGNLPEFDSMAVMNIITTMEEQRGIILADDDIVAENFETVGSLVALVQKKLAL